MKFHREIAKIFGYDLIRIKKHPSIESNLSCLLGKFNIDLVIDVGANRGQYGSMLRSLGYRGTICSFEPVTESYQKLSDKTARDGRWTSYQLAVGSRAATLDINVMKNSVFSSLLKPNAYGLERFEEHSEIDRVERIAVVTLDGFINEHAEYDAHKNILLKADTQGHDLEVIKGASKLLNKVAILQTEIAFKPIYDGAPHHLDALKYYEDAGFEMSGLYPISRDHNNLALIEVDCTLVRKFG